MDTMHQIIQKFLTLFLIVCIIIYVIFLANESLQFSLKSNAIISENNTTASLTDTEQEAINTYILQDWGHPENADIEHVKALSGIYTSMPITQEAGEFWYYLTGDTVFNFSFTRGFSENTTIHILMNGYVLDGDVNFIFASKETSISFYDRIPNKTAENNDIYRRNPICTHFLKFKNDKYAEYFSQKPENCINVTDFPTYQDNTYITVHGSLIGRASNYSGGKHCIYIQGYGKKLIFFGMNLVGMSSYLNSISLINNTDSQGLPLEIISSNIIGVYSWAAQSVLSFASGNTKIVDSNIYGNRLLTLNATGVIINNINYNDIRTNNGDTGLDVYKSTIGIIRGDAQNKEYLYNLKNAIFPFDTIGILQLNAVNFHNVIQNMDNIQGTIELISSITLNYQGNSPNLTFIVFGENTKYEDNSLTLQETTVLDTVELQGGEFIQNSGSVQKIKVSSGNYTLNGASTTGDDNNNYTANSWEINTGASITLEKGKLKNVMISGGSFTQNNGSVETVSMNSGLYSFQAGDIEDVSVYNGNFTQVDGNIKNVFIHGGVFEQNNGTIQNMNIENGDFTVHAGIIEKMTLNNGNFTQLDGTIQNAFINGGSVRQNNGSVESLKINSGEYTLHAGTIENVAVHDGNFTQADGHIIDITLYSGNFRQDNGNLLNAIMYAGELTQNNGNVYNFILVEGNYMKYNGILQNIIINNGTFRENASTT